jgi:hypothetical protein
MTAASPSPQPEQPRLQRRFGGTSFLANIEVKVVDPNAPDWLERLAARLKK